MGIVFVLVLPKIYLSYNTESFYEVLLALLTLTVIITIVGGFLSQKFGDKIVTKRRKKVLRKEVFQEFLKQGFDNNEVSISGYVDEYYTIISAEQEIVQPRKWLEIVILFNPKQQNQFIPSYVFEKLYKLNKKEYEWSSNCLTIKKVYGVKLPKYTEVRNLISEAVLILKNNNIESINEYDWDLSLSESVNRYKQISNLKV